MPDSSIEELRTRKRKILMFRYVHVALSILLFAASASAAGPQAKPDISGLWKQDNDRCQPKRNGDVTLRIEHRDPELTVETSIARGSAPPRLAVQKYTTDGKVSVSIGADGDEFHTSAVWKDSDLAFSIEEHENGRVIRSNEIWSVVEHGATLKRIRERPDGEKQTLLYRLVGAGRSETKSDVPRADGK